MRRPMIGFMFLILSAFLFTNSACTRSGGSSSKAPLSYKYQLTSGIEPSALSASPLSNESFTVKWNEDASGRIRGVFVNDQTAQSIRITGTSNSDGRVINGTLPEAIGQATRLRLIISQTGPINGNINITFKLLTANGNEVSSESVLVAAETLDDELPDDTDDSEEEEEPSNLPAALLGSWDRWANPIPGCATLGVADRANALTISNSSNPISFFHHIASMGAPQNFATYFHPDNSGKWFFETSYADGTTYQSLWNPTNPTVITMSFVRNGTACTGQYWKHVEEEEEEEPPAPQPLGTFVGTRTCTGGDYAGQEVEITVVTTTLPTSTASTATVTIKKSGTVVYGPSALPFESYTAEPNYTHVTSGVFSTESNAYNWSFTAKYRPSMDNFLVNDFTGLAGNASNCSNFSLTRQ